MDGTKTIDAHRTPLAETMRLLQPIQSISDNDPWAVWEEDGKRIRLLTEALQSMEKNGQPGAERIAELLAVLRLKRCDLGRRLLQSIPASDGRSVWAEQIELKIHRAKV